MTVTWRGAFHYALIVAGLSWLVGTVVELALLVGFGNVGEWRTSTPADGWDLAVPVAAAVSLTAARRFLPPLPRWRVIVVDSVLHTVVLLLCSGVTAWATGDEAPADTAFVMGTFALLSLQLPAAWCLSAWRSGHLEIVVRPTKAARRSDTERTD